MSKQTIRGLMFSALEVSKLCGVVNQTAINWIKAGHLKASKTPGGQYRIYADDLLFFLEQHEMRIPEDLIKQMRSTNQTSFLVIDDDKEFNTLLTAQLNRKFPEVRVSQAYDGFEAGKLLNKLHPHIVFLDINLPGVNGVAICRNIKNDTSLGKVYVLAISGVDDENEKSAILREGAEEFLPKPLDMEYLLNKVEKIMVKGLGYERGV